jgi:hypothetical protein
MPDGRVLVAGGSAAAVETYDRSLDQFAEGGQLPSGAFSGSGSTALVVQSAYNALTTGVGPGIATSTSVSNPNVPYASVKVCLPGTTQCRTVDGVVVDTGSWGLRLFASKLQGVPFTGESVSTPSGQLGECAFFGSGESWGAVAEADVYIAGELAKSVPIQIMNDTGGFASEPSGCKVNVFTSPTASNAGFNGILGVGDLAIDTSGTYYSCAGQSCSPLNDNLIPTGVTRVENPAAFMRSTTSGGSAADYNGVALAMNAASAGGQATDFGSLIFGIGTQPNNTPAPGVFVFTPNSESNTITVIYNGTDYPGFIDSGSNAIFVNNTSLAQCIKPGPPGGPWYCPSGQVKESATNENIGSSGTTNTVDFILSNVTFDGADEQFPPGVDALPQLGGPFGTGQDFDWGLTFFYGRTVYVGISGEVSQLGNGPFWAY